MSDQNHRSWSFYIDDMLLFAHRVAEYTNGLNQRDFEDDNLKFDATIRNLELIGEAATHIPDHVRQLHQDVPWRQIIATRNQLIHGYLGIDNDTLWSIIKDDIPDLISKLERVQKATQVK